jgi:seryl-tRNA synthetase
MNNDALKEETMLSQGAIIERAMKAQRKQIEMLQQQLELKESEYQSAIDKVNRSTKVAQELQQQNKQLIEALEEIKDEEWRLAGEFTTIYTTAYLALQQIEGDERTKGTMCGEWEGKDNT